MIIEFCKKCHKVVMLNGKISVKGKITLRCPDGHKVEVNGGTNEH